MYIWNLEKLCWWTYLQGRDRDAFCWQLSLCTRSLLLDSSKPGGREHLEMLTKGAPCMSRCPSASCIPSWVSACAPCLLCPVSRRMQKRKLRALALRFVSLGGYLRVYSWEECSKVLCPDPFSPRQEKGSQAGPLWREEPQASRVWWSPGLCPLHPWKHPSHQGEDRKGKGPPFLWEPGGPAAGQTGSARPPAWQSQRPLR